MPREKIADQIRRIRKLGARRDLETGMIYTRDADLRSKHHEITLYGLFVSDENTFLIRPHIFHAKNGRTAREWEQWFRDEYGTILRNAILPGMENRTGKQWRLYRVIGWTPRALARVKNPAKPRGRNRSKSQGRKNGRSNPRRG